MINEANFLKAVIGYLDDNVAGVAFCPVKQKVSSLTFPCGVVNISSQTGQAGIAKELLAQVTVHISVYADEIYATTSSSGVLTVCDSIAAALGEKGFTRVNQTEPFYNTTYRKWGKDIVFKIKANAF